MKILIQRVKHAKVDVEGRTVGSIGPGALVFFGATHGDTKEKADWLISKLIHLRIFADEAGKMNRSLLDIKGSVLVVSQFTLYADCSEGRRPSFTSAASPLLAEELYNYFVSELRKHLSVATGIFAAYMEVSLLNDGPITLSVEK